MGFFYITIVILNVFIILIAVVIIAIIIIVIITLVIILNINVIVITITGVVNCPLVGLCYTAVRGLGAFCNGKKLKTSGCKQLSKVFFFFSFFAAKDFVKIVKVLIWTLQYQQQF